MASIITVIHKHCDSEHGSPLCESEQYSSLPIPLNIAKVASRTSMELNVHSPNEQHQESRSQDEEHKSSTTPEQDNNSKPSSRLNVVAHQRWSASKAVKFLNTIDKIEIDGTHDRGGVVFYLLRIFVKPAENQSVESSSTTKSTASEQYSYTIEHRFSDFDKLREDVAQSVRILPQCTCDYCTDFVLYTRFNVHQPRGVVKIVANVEKRKVVLASFVNELVRLGRRRVQQKSLKRKCHGQDLVPALLEAFLLEQQQSVE